MTAQVACQVSDLDVEEALGVVLSDEAGRDVPVAIARDNEGTFHAVHDVCTHGQVALSEGEVEGCAIECWLHGSTFSLTTGAPQTLPATIPVKVYPVHIDGPDVLVDVDTTVN